MADHHSAGIAMAVVATIGYGLAPPLTRFALDYGVPTMESVLWRTASITLVLLLVLAASQRAEGVLERLITAWRPLAAQLAATAMVSFGYLASVQFIPVSQAVMIFFMFPVLILITSMFVEGLRPTPVRVALALLAFTGLAIVIGPSLETSNLLGLGLAFVASLGATLQFYSGRALAGHFSPAWTGFLTHLALLPAALAVAFAVGGGKLAILEPSTLPTTGYVILVVLGLAYAAGYYSHMKALTFAPPSVIAPYYNLEPLVAIATAIALLGEIMQPHQYAGGMMVLAALVLSSYFGRSAKQQATR